MITLFWNRHGAGSTLTVRVLKELCRKFDPDFVSLMETKNKDRKMEKFRKNRVG